MFRQPDGETAGEQADRVEDGKLQHVAWLRPGDALAYVIEIGNHKNSEDRGLGKDQGRHGDGAVIGQDPVFVSCSVSQGYRAGAHPLYILDGQNQTIKIIRTGNPDLPGASGPTTVCGWPPLVRLQSCIRAEERRLPTPASRHPRGLVRRPGL